MVKRITILVALLLGLGLSAFADDMTLANVGASAAGVYVYPYYLTVTSGQNSTTYAVVCDSFYNTVTLGESWTGSVNMGSDLTNTMFGKAAASAYAEAAYIFANYMTNPSNAAAGNFAIWSLFLNYYTQTNSSETAMFNAGYGTAAQNIAAAAKAWYAGASSSDISWYLASLKIFTPDSSFGAYLTTQGPQEYLCFVAVPEPGSLLLFGMGLLVGCGAWKRRAALRSHS